MIYCKSEDVDYHGFDFGGKLTITKATEKSEWTDWETIWKSEKDYVGEPLLAHARWEQKILSVYTLEKPDKPVEPSSLCVIDFTL